MMSRISVHSQIERGFSRCKEVRAYPEGNME